MIRISPNDRLFISGRTGSGKTTLVRFLLRSVPRYVVLDAKHTYHGPADLSVPVVPAFDPELPQQIIRPPYEAHADVFPSVCEQVWRDGNRLLYVDECRLITRLNPIVPELGKCIITGRERGVGVWTGTQRPKLIPSECFTEAEHIISFKLQYKLDKDRVVEYTGDIIRPLLNSLQGHSAVYYNVPEDRALLLQPRLTRALPAPVRELTGNADTNQLVRHRYGGYLRRRARQVGRA